MSSTKKVEIVAVRLQTRIACRPRLIPIASTESLRQPWLLLGREEEEAIAVMKRQVAALKL
jgi:hypothetical protein